jgi:DNA-directed RNA polymerase specialized sigma24 family protein
MRRDPASAPTATAVQVFDILARQNAQMLTAFLRSLVLDSHAVDDLFQETMLVAWRRLPDYDHALPFGPWLRGIAGKLVLEHRRKSAARAALRCEPELLEALETEFERFEREPADSFHQRLESLSPGETAAADARRGEAAVHAGALARGVGRGPRRRARGGQEARAAGPAAPGGLSQGGGA